MKEGPSDKAVDRISKELQGDLDEIAKNMPVVKMKDGKAFCPACSQEIQMLESPKGVQWVRLTLPCQNCGRDVIIEA